MTEPVTTQPQTSTRPALWPRLSAYAAVTALLLLACELAIRDRLTDALPALTTFRQLLPRLIGALFITGTLLIAVQLTGRRWLGLALGAIPWLLLALVSSLKRSVTADPLIPADLLLSSGTLNAAIDAVALPILPLLLLFALIAAAIYADRRRPTPPRPWRNRLALTAITLVTCTLLWLASGPLATIGWIDSGILRARPRYNSYGLATGFLFDLRDLNRYRLPAPDGYSAAAISAIAARYPAAPAPTQPLPSIIIIQLESLLDPAQTNLLPPGTEVLPNLRALHQRFGVMHAVSAVYGGRSANSEFEANTGLSMTLLPDDSVAYEHIVRRDIPSLARVLGHHGYHSTSIVCGYANMFRYREVYAKHMAFDEVVFAADLMPSATRFDQIPDPVVLDRVLKAIETSPGPAYIFASTGRNHAPWTAQKYPTRTFESALPPDLPSRPDFAAYLQGAHECDAAVGMFLDRLKTLNRPALVFFYGDHQPGLPAELLQRAGFASGSSPATPSELLSTHTTMAAFWTNVPDAKFPSGLIGLNYAGSALLQAAGIDHPFYTGVLGSARRHTRALAPGFYVGIDGLPLPTAPASAQADLHDAALLQYDVLAGSQHSIGTIFTPLTTHGRSSR